MGKKKAKPKKSEEVVLHNALNKAFGSENLIIRKNFKYKDEHGTMCEMDHCIVDKQRKILVVFGDKSFKNHLTEKANYAYRENVEQNLRFEKGIRVHPEIVKGKGEQKECIDIGDIECIIYFNVIYPVVKTDDSIYINNMYNTRFHTELNDESKTHYRQLTIGYSSLIRILVYCKEKEVKFIEFIEILSNIYSENRENLDFGIGIQSAFECIQEGKNSNKGIISLVIADVNQNRLKIKNNNEIEFYSTMPYVINAGCYTDDIRDIIKEISKEAQLKIYSKKRYIEILHRVIDRLLSIHTDNPSSSYKLRQSANDLVGRKCTGY